MCFSLFLSSILLGELKAIAFGLAEAIKVGASKVVVESDSKALVEHIVGVEPWSNEFGTILQDIFRG